MDQLELLVGKHDWYGKGSRVIITTRDKCWLNMLKLECLYEVKGLNSNDALMLFSQHAFQANLPKEDLKVVLDHVIHYCEGLPLALKVLGSLLYGKTRGEWESELHKLEEELEGKIQNVLKRSFDGLDPTQKMTFLDIACFFEGEDRDFASKILEGCKLYGEINIAVLLERCLITISCNRIYMHGLIKQMGRNIVREQHLEDPSKWNRLWNPKDIYCALKSKKGMKNVETIYLDWSTSKETWFTTKIFAQMKRAFAKMKKLRLLKVYNGHGDEYKMPLLEHFEFPSTLRYLHWEGLESLPLNFHGENLVAINLKSSNIKELLEREKSLAELKFIDLSNSQQLIKIPEFSRMPKLEKLNLKGCISFCKLYLSFEMKFLTEINFSGSGIRELSSSIGSLISLEILSLSECLNFEKFPEIQGNMKCLKELSLEGTVIKELPNSIGSLISLETLNLSKCSKFEKFPEIQGNMKCLKELSLDKTVIKELPNSVGCLEALESLSLIGCSNFEKFPEIHRNMGSLQALFLNETAIKELPRSIGHLTGLGRLNLENCTNLRSLPSSICGLKSLKGLDLNGCSNLVAFPEIMESMEHSKRLFLRGTPITELPCKHLKGLNHLELNNCENLVSLPNSIGNLTCLSVLRVRNCSKLHMLPDSLRSLQCCLIRLDLAGCNLMEGAVPSDLWCLSSLAFLDVCENHIRCIPAGIVQLSKLRHLRMNHCQMLEEIPELPSSLELIEAHGCPCLGTSSTPSSPLWSSLLNLFKSRIQDFGCQTDSEDSEDSKDYMPNSETSVVIPGSGGIPEWISHKSMGHKIRIELPKNWYEDNNFFGFALFFHHVPFDDDECQNEYDDIPRCELRISHDDQSERVGEIECLFSCKRCSISGLSYYAICYHNSSTSDPALWATCFPKFVIPRHTRWKNFKAYFNCSINRPFQCGTSQAFKVKSCGIHLIYAQDHHQQHQNHWPDPLRENTNSSAKRSHNDTEEDPHQKRSRHL